MKIVAITEKIIAYAFYALFIIVPLTFTSSTSELFELNKMWFTFALTLIITGAWAVNMLAKHEVKIQRTPLDIPLLLFLLANIISTIFSLDPRTSVWGYYSRFNGGLLSILCYFILYYAFVSNFTIKEVIRNLWVSLIAGIIVALWGLPSHFGYDPTCYLFRGTLDVSCWTEAFQPTVRIFSTLGQPAWLAAYLSILLPIVIALMLHESVKQLSDAGKTFLQKHTKLFLFFFVLLNLFYVDLLFANTKAGFIGFWIGNLFFWGILYIKNILERKQFLLYFLSFNACILFLNFLFSTPIQSLNTFTLPTLRSAVAKPEATPALTTDGQQKPSDLEKPVGSITDSGDIRLLVWRGGIEAWKAHPLFGTGVETFAYAYYQYRPAAHNLTSEWDYLYNKAHNEYINYLTTTGIFGLGSYLAIILVFFVTYGKFIYTQFISRLLNRNLSKENVKEIDNHHVLLSLALVSSYISILISNFFGFSVVIINIYFFLIPVFVFILSNLLPKKYLRFSFSSAEEGLTTTGQWIGTTAIIIVVLFSFLQLFRFWLADKAYALGHNYSLAGQYQEAYTNLQEAVSLRPAEPVFSDEFAVTSGTIASLLQPQDATSAAQIKEQAIALSDSVITKHPNNVVFWKDRVRLFYALGQSEPRYLVNALDSMQKAHSLAPTDVKIMYNLGVLLGQNNRVKEGIEMLEEAARNKPNYRDVYFALGLFYHDLSESSTGPEKSAYLTKAKENMQYILDHIGSNDKTVIDTLHSWNK